MPAWLGGATEMVMAMMSSSMPVPGQRCLESEGRFIVWRLRDILLYDCFRHAAFYYLWWRKMFSFLHARYACRVAREII